jgi:hypothetical protein
MTALELTEKVQDGVIKVMETSQNWTLGALKSSTSAFDSMKPDPSRIPFADRMPTPTETVETTFSFAGRILDAQHAFLTGLVELTATPATTVVTAKKA